MTEEDNIKENANELYNDGLSNAGVIAIIVVISVILITLSIAGYIIFRKLKERRRSHGEYRPQFEEYQHAKNLPYLQPPAIEGLI